MRGGIEGLKISSWLDNWYKRSLMLEEEIVSKPLAWGMVDLERMTRRREYPQVLHDLKRGQRLEHAQTDQLPRRRRVGIWQIVLIHHWDRHGYLSNGRGLIIFS